MRRPATPIFLERRSYRQRRVRDAARLLPLLGLVLWMLPLLFGVDGTPALTSQVLLYVFGVWLGLAVAAAALSLGLDSAPGPADATDGPYDSDGDTDLRSLAPAPLPMPLPAPVQAQAPDRRGDAD
jgi:hypothetical protein